jgi:hypothetical protein
MIHSNLLTWRIVLRLSATFVFTQFLFTACKKKDTSLGISSIDQNELLNSGQIDTFTLITYSEVEDSIVTSSPFNALLGSYNDPKFGPCEASFFTQIRLAANSPNFGDLSTIVVDSLVLGLKYTGSYGDLSAQTVEVYELTDSLGRTTSYYSFSNKPHSTTNLVDPARAQITPDPYTQIVIDTTHVAAQMRIYLDTNLAKTWMLEAGSGSTSFASNENFLTYFKGFAVKVNNGNLVSGKGGVLYFDLGNTLSKLTIYYRQAGIKKTYDFVINSSCANFNRVVIDNSGKPVESVVNTPNLGQTQFYSQAMASRAVIHLPGIDDLPKKSIIHEATLLLPIDYQTGYKYMPGDELTISTRLDDGTTALYSIGLGVYDAANKRFSVDLRAYIQTLISGQRIPVNVSGTVVNALILGTEIRVNPRLYNSSMNRIVFNGSNTINKNKPKLILKYTEF